MKIGIGQINPTIGDFSGNQEKILELVAKAKNDLVDMIVFPEMCVCGYPPNDLLDHDRFAQENRKSLRWLQQNCPAGIAVLIGYVDRNREFAGKALMNVASVILNGRIVFTQAKTLLPTYDVFDETRYFEPAPERRVWEYMNERIGIAICEDLWWETEGELGIRYPVDPVDDLLNAGATLIVAPSASPFYAEKLRVRFSLLSKIGKSSGVPVVYVNMVGGNDSLIFDGQSLVTSKTGKLIHRGSGFCEEYTAVDLDADSPAVKLEVDRYQEIEDALVIGIRDYLGKCGFSSVHLGLSGGIDSALVAVLAVRAVGRENVKTFGMPSRYSSSGSVDDARELCENLGISYDIIPIEDPFKAFLESLEPHFLGKEPDIAEENLQARIRGTLLMAYSNKWGSLVLTTGNKSELAVGYCTLYGDMCGGLSVIGDLFKTEVIALCRHLNLEEEVIPDAILTKPPSAELRPDQIDEDSLPPYDILDEVLSLYLLDSKTGVEIVAAGYDRELVSRVLGLVGRSEYKRRQAPPVLKVSPKAFGTGRRMPIARFIYEAAE
ncbi:MAG: NAD+ synthase [Spirochaetales bacterium]|jgi:NAD+ synthase (glutamine-hydrolysing)|nr:NAD+ synthase [Spirochaetales bacterium]